jgi:leucyl aminopeptidase (aminopeptidase T)
MMDKMKKAIQTALTDCLALKKGEEFLAIGDEPSREIAMAFWEAARKMKAESVYVEIIPRSSHAEEPPAPVAALMAKSRVIVAPTSKSLSHTAARKRIITEGKSAHIKSSTGTDLRMSIEGMRGLPDTGIVHKPGDFSNLPAGEAFVAPAKGSAEGILVVDGSMAGVGIVKKLIKITMKNGEAVKIEGSKKLEAIMEKYGRDARNVAELGVGTNDKVRLSGNVLEDEKVLGTVHVALGDNSTFGGTVSVPVHLDGIIREPVLTVDGKVIVKDGKLVI